MIYLCTGMAFLAIWHQIDSDSSVTRLIQLGFLISFMLMGITWLNTVDLEWTKVLPSIIAFCALTFWTLRDMQGTWVYCWLIFHSGMTVSVIFALIRKAFGWLKTPPQFLPERSKLPGFVVPELFGFAPPVKINFFVLLSRFKILDIMLLTGAIGFFFSVLRPMDTTLPRNFLGLLFYSGLLTCLLSWLILQIAQRVQRTSISFLTYTSLALNGCLCVQIVLPRPTQAELAFFIPYGIATFCYWLGIRYLHAHGYRLVDRYVLQSDEHAASI